MARYLCPQCKCAQLAACKGMARASKLSLRKKQRPPSQEVTGRGDAAQLLLPHHARPPRVVGGGQECPPYLGLPNPGGNLCYLNAVLQAIANTLRVVPAAARHLSGLVRGVTAVGSPSGTEEATIDTSVGAEVGMVLSRLLRANHELRCRTAAPGSPGGATAVVEDRPHALAVARALRAEGGFEPGAQHDAAEALLGLLQQTPHQTLHQTRRAGRRAPRGRHSAGASSSPRLSQSPWPSLGRLFEGAVRTSTECLDCGHTNHRSGPERSLRLCAARTSALCNTFK